MKTSWPDILFFAIVCGIALGAALRVVLSKNAVHSALMLALTLFSVAVIFIAQSAPFLAAVQMIVYAGAVVVLFLFVIMLLGVDKNEDLRETLRGQRPAALGLALLFAVGTVGVIRLYGSGAPQAEAIALGADNVQLIADALFTTYLYAFEITAAPLLVAAIAAVVLAKRERPAKSLSESREDGSA
ncbi:MAG: hypothetical protein DCC49_03055 [Acidobacteria bacterium]|nr:MAG: hypothetical protein DCC49_03055 [Acidobacteriota bacterium]